MSIENVERIDGVAQYDLIVIGSGSGNTLIGPEWDDKKVALIDGGIYGDHRAEDPRGQAPGHRRTRRRRALGADS